MVAYSFKAQFVEPILWGRKAQTIRAPRRAGVGHAYPGQKLQLYRGMRTRSCQLILRTVCTKTAEVLLRWRPVIDVHIGDERLAPSDYDAFAQADGFSDFEDMEIFWAETHKSIDCFRGTLISWLAPTSPVEMGTDLTPQERAA